MPKKKSKAPPPVLWIAFAELQSFFALDHRAVELHKAKREIRTEGEGQRILYNVSDVAALTDRAPTIERLTSKSAKHYAATQLASPLGNDDLQLLNHEKEGRWRWYKVCDIVELAERKSVQAAIRLVDVDENDNVVVDGTSCQTLARVVERVGVSRTTLCRWIDEHCALLGKKLPARKVRLRRHEPHETVRVGHVVETTLVDEIILLRNGGKSDDWKTIEEIAALTSETVKAVYHRARAHSRKKVSRVDERGRPKTMWGYNYREYLEGQQARRAAALAKLGVSESHAVASPKRPGPKPTAADIQRFCYEKLAAGVKRAAIPGQIARTFGEEKRPKNAANVSEYARRHAFRAKLPWPIKRGGVTG